MEASIPTIIMTTWNGLLWHHYGPMRLPRIRNFWKPARSFGKTLRKVGMIIRAVALPGEKPSLDYKNTPANAPAVILAARLYELQQKPEDLEWAKKIYQWQKSSLVDSHSGLVWDGINRNGDEKIDKDWKFTYNQGVFIGAAMALFKQTGEQFYLNDALKTADFTISDGGMAPGGVLKSEGQGDGGLFKGILVRYLAALTRSSALADEKKAVYREFLRQNAVALDRNI